jgi:predicted alpha/beta-fold hydrolase
VHDPEHFKAAWWLRNAHAQTLWASLCRFTPRPTYHRQRLELADGDFLDIDWAQPPQSPASTLVLILHGLEGSSNSSYARGLVQAMQRRKMQCLVMNFRGCSGEANRLQRSYHSGESGDLDQVVRWLRHHYPSRRIAVVGFSLGGNVLLKWLGEQSRDALVDAAAAACVPMQLAVCADRMEQGFSRVYLWRLVRSLRDKIKRKFMHRPGSPLDLARVAKCRGFWAFDEHVTAPLHGFSSAADYYQRCSSRQYLCDIARPTLLLHAADDPFMTYEVLPDSCELSSSVTLQVSENGGHVGFVEGVGVFGLLPNYWLDERISAFIAARTQSVTSRPC